MTLSQQMTTIGCIVLATMLTRFLPYLLYPEHKKVPDYIVYLGQVLPGAIFGMLVIYCLKDVRLLTGSQCIPELLAIGVVVILHLWKRQMLISIAGGVICYMVLAQMFF